MSDLTEMVAWLGGQIELDKSAALNATPGGWGADIPSTAEDSDPYPTSISSLNGAKVVSSTGPGSAVSIDDALHIARHDPQNVIADCDAKLAIIDNYADTTHIRDEAAERIRAAGDHPAAEDLDTWDRAQREIPVMEHWVRLLAQGYRHRDGYREEWRP